MSPRDSPRWVRRNTASFGSGPIWFLDCRAKLNDSPQKRASDACARALPRLQACYLLREKTCIVEGLAAEARNAMNHRREFVMANFPINERERERDEIKTAMKEESPRNGHEFAHWTV